jgi:hypothetical protein
MRNILRRVIIQASQRKQKKFVITGDSLKYGGSYCFRLKTLYTESWTKYRMQDSIRGDRPPPQKLSNCYTFFWEQGSVLYSWNRANGPLLIQFKQGNFISYFKTVRQSTPKWPKWAVSKMFMEHIIASLFYYFILLRHKYSSHLVFRRSQSFHQSNRTKMHVHINLDLMLEYCVY